ncbi:MAG: Voltage-gated potassium channel Kch [Candidatus Marinimicrobia bacterium]|nr:Voltage-gated potassium channel Kch [Candidatus Neomarinimicrobiota bacterium]
MANNTSLTASAQNIFWILLIVVSVLLIGTIGFIIIEGWRFLDALYMTIITLSTVGFRETGPLSSIGQVWTILLIVFGISVIGYTGVTQISRYLVEIQFFRKQRELRKIKKMDDHYIVCGFGRMGRVIVEDFIGRNQETVIIENKPEVVDEIVEHNYTYIEGSAIEDETLIQAGIDRAKGLVTVLSTDADNLFVTLSARNLNPGLFILTRSREKGTQEKMRTAGANKVVNPYEIGAHKMAQMVLSPHVDDFIEIVSRQRKLNLAIDQIRVYEHSDLANRKLMDTPIRSQFDTIVTAILDSSNEMKFNPSSETEIQPGDILICIGDRGNLEELENMAKGV